MTLTITAEMRHHLAHEVEHFSHLLPPQGPISTFIHHNTLHGLQHLPFEQALAEGERVLGGRCYFANDEYRRLYSVGRIADEDISVALAARGPAQHGGALLRVGHRTVDAAEVCRLHLVYRIDATERTRLRFELYQRDGIRRFRADIPGAVRASLLEKAAAELQRSLARVGTDWTLSDWIAAHTGLDVRRYVSDDVASRVRAADGAGVPAESPDRSLARLAIPAERRAGYLARVDAATGELAGSEREDLRRAWLDAERRLLGRLARRHFGVAGTLTAIAQRFERDPEEYGALALWQACLAGFGLPDPCSLINPVNFADQDPDAAPEFLDAAVDESGESAPAGQREARLRMLGYAEDALDAAIERLQRL